MAPRLFLHKFAASSGLIVVSQVPLTRLIARLGEPAQIATANIATAAGMVLLLRAGNGIGYALGGGSADHPRGDGVRPAVPVDRGPHLPQPPDLRDGSSRSCGVWRSRWRAWWGWRWSAWASGSASFLAAAVACLLVSGLAVVLPHHVTQRTRPVPSPSLRE